MNTLLLDKYDYQYGKIAKQFNYVRNEDEKSLFHWISEDKILTEIFDMRIKTYMTFDFKMIKQGLKLNNFILIVKDCESKDVFIWKYAKEDISLIYNKDFSEIQYINIQFDKFIKLFDNNDLCVC